MDILINILSPGRKVVLNIMIYPDLAMKTEYMQGNRV